MKTSEMIFKLQNLQDQFGDIEVLISDGYKCNCYRGDYDIVKWKDDNNHIYVDIGIGGCEE